MLDIFEILGADHGWPIQFPYGGGRADRPDGPDAAGRTAGKSGHWPVRLLCGDRSGPRNGPGTGGGPAGHEAGRSADSQQLCGGGRAGTGIYHSPCGTAGGASQHGGIDGGGRQRQKNLRAGRRPPAADGSGWISWTA